MAFIRRRGLMLCVIVFTLSLPLSIPFSIPFSIHCYAQSQTTAPNTSSPTTPAARPEDVASIEAIIAAVYDVISGPAGKLRDWNRMRSLFIPDARLIPTARRPNGEIGSRTVSVEGYIERTTPAFAKEGFYEREVARRTEQFGHIAHVFSTYESRHKPDDAVAFHRGINSIQLLNDGKRWWVVTIFWANEDDQLSLPAKYLPGGQK